MEHVAALMLMIVCPGPADTCREIPAPVVGYETLEECRADIPGALGSARAGGAITVARCLAVDPAFEGDLEIVWNVDDDKGLIASIDYDNKIDDRPLNVAFAGDPEYSAGRQ